MIPQFNDSGHLPVGGHHCTWEELYERFRFNNHRVSLCEKLNAIVGLARRCGFIAVMIGGSFPTTKVAPNDMDLAWLTEPNITKEDVRPECVKLMDDMLAEEYYEWNMMYLAIDSDEAQVQFWAKMLGYCTETGKDRGMLVIEL